MSRLSICIYCGSRAGVDPAYAAAAREVGTLLGRMGAQLVYGGGHAGLMGILADAALAAGAPVVGVIPQTLMSRELSHAGITELHVVETMHERKRLMAERSDAFVALPGGIGTLEEMFEAWTWRQLGYHDKPLGLLNTGGYFDRLLAFLGETEKQGFVLPAQSRLLQVDAEAAPLLQRLAALAAQATEPDDYRQI